MSFLHLLQEVQAPGLKFIWKKQFSMFFSLSRLYFTLTTIKTSEFSTLGRFFLKRVRFRYVTNHLKRRHYRVCSPADCSTLYYLYTCPSYPNITKIIINCLLVTVKIGINTRIMSVWDTKINQFISHRQQHCILYID